MWSSLHFFYFLPHSFLLSLSLRIYFLSFISWQQRWLGLTAWAASTERRRRQRRSGGSDGVGMSCDAKIEKSPWLGTVRTALLQFFLFFFPPIFLLIFWFDPWSSSIRHGGVHGMDRRHGKRRQRTGPATERTSTACGCIDGVERRRARAR